MKILADLRRKDKKVIAADCNVCNNFLTQRICRILHDCKFNSWKQSTLLTSQETLIAAAERQTVSGSLGESGGPGAVVMWDTTDTLPT